MSGILRKRARGDSLTADEHVMMEMKENNYWAMFKDSMIVLSVLLYGMWFQWMWMEYKLIMIIIPSGGSSHSNHIWYTAACLAGLKQVCWWF